MSFPLSLKLATLRKKRTLAARIREINEAHPRNTPRLQENYITQVSEEIGGRVTKKLSQGFNQAESRILVSLSRIDEVLHNPHAQAQSGHIPWIFSRLNQATNEDTSQNIPHPEIELSLRQLCQSLGKEEVSYRLG